MLYFSTSCGGSKTETKLLIRKEWSVYHFVCIIIIRVPIFVVFSRAILCVQLSCVYHFVRGVARFYCQGGWGETYRRGRLDGTWWVLRGGSRNFCMSVKWCHIFVMTHFWGGPGACSRWKLLNYGSLKRHFLHFEDILEQNITKWTRWHLKY